MHRLSVAALGILAAGCIARTVLRAPEPVNLHVSDAPRAVIQRAAVALTSAGFRVAQTDSVGSVLGASRRSRPNGNEPFVTCNMPRNSGAAANRETTITIDFSARPASGGTDVTIRSNVRTTYPGFDGTPMQMATSDSDCVSTGLMERRLAESIR